EQPQAMGRGATDDAGIDHLDRGGRSPLAKQLIEEWDVGVVVTGLQMIEPDAERPRVADEHDSRRATGLGYRDLLPAQAALVDLKGLVPEAGRVPPAENRIIFQPFVPGPEAYGVLPHAWCDPECRFAHQRRERRGRDRQNQTLHALPSRQAAGAASEPSIPLVRANYRPANEGSSPAGARPGTAPESSDDPPRRRPARRRPGADAAGAAPAPPPTLAPQGGERGPAHRLRRRTRDRCDDHRHRHAG